MAEITSVTTIENKIYIKGNMKIDKIENGAENRMDEQFQKLAQFWILIIFQTKKKI